MKIYFAGYLKSPFIQQDRDLLSEEHELIIFDLSKHSSSFKQIPTYLIRTLFELPKILTSDLIWIWFADYPTLPIMIMAKLFRKKIAVNVGGWEVCNVPEINYGNQRSLMRGCATRWILRNSNVCITKSEAYKKIIEKLEQSANVGVIPGWIDIELCNSPLPKKHGVMTAYCSYFLVEIIKGIPTFKSASEGFPATISHDIPHSELIEQLKKSKVYCQLSYTESFAVTLLEAMACGCIPIITKRGALPELVGQCGIIVPYGDVEKTRDAISLAFEGGTTDIIAVRKRAMEYSKENCRAKLKKLLEGL